MSLRQFAKEVEAPAAKTLSGDLDTLTGFMEQLSDDGLRISYVGFGRVAEQLDIIPGKEVGRPSSLRVVRALPAHLQPLVCRENGTYAKATREKWDVDPPEGLEERQVIGADVAQEALASYLQTLEEGGFDESDDSEEE